MGNINFNANNVTPDSGEFAPIPPGWYVAKIDGAEMITSKNEDAGLMLKLELVIDEESHPEVGARRVFTNLVINHKNAVPRKIAERKLSAICHAIGTLELEDTDQLLGEMLKIRLKVRPAKGDYEASNDVEGFRSVSDETAKPTDAPAEQAEEKAPAKPSKGAKGRSWKK